MLNSPMLSIFQHFHAIPLRSPLISLRSKWRLTGFSRRFTPKNPVRLHNPFGELPRWGAKNVLPLNLIASFPQGRAYGGQDTDLLQIHLSGLPKADKRSMMLLCTHPQVGCTLGYLRNQNSLDKRIPRLAGSCKSGVFVSL